MIEIVRKIYELARIIETEHLKTGKFSEKNLSQLQLLLSSLQTENDLELQKIAEIADHLHPKMTLQHFSNFILPLERYLGKSVADSDFMITTKDAINIHTKKFPIVVVLENLRSAFNVGSIFRTADAVGVKHLYLCGYTPTPKQEVVLKTTMDSHDHVSWSHHTNIDEVITKLKSEGYTIVALETSEKSISFYSKALSEKTAFVFGNERFGMRAETLAMVDEIRHVPMYGYKNSLNVANTASIVLYEWNRQHVQS